MNTSTRLSLDRTLLLMRDDLRPEVSDGILVEALTRTEVVLVGDAQNLKFHAAQCAFVTTALLMARSGHRVYLLKGRVAGHHATAPARFVLADVHASARGGAILWAARGSSDIAGLRGRRCGSPTVEPDRAMPA